jgi:NAD(P) transhydrogenase subunit alpha
MSTEIIITSLFIFALAGLLGLEVIHRVPKLLHTPLMALTNALSAISLVGSLLILGFQDSTYATILGFIAVVAATINVVGGFLITDKMLRMFKKRERPAAPADPGAGR